MKTVQFHLRSGSEILRMAPSNWGEWGREEISSFLKTWAISQPCVIQGAHDQSTFSQAMQL